MDEVIKSVAEETLGVFADIESAALDWLKDEKEESSSNGVLNSDAETSIKAAKILSDIKSSLHSSYSHLTSEPSLARVNVSMGNGDQATYYICRHAAPTGMRLNAKIASRNAPVGRIASLEPGDEFVLPNGTELEVINVTHLKPAKGVGKWDSRRNIFASLDSDPITIDSFRQLLELEPEEPVQNESVVISEQTVELPSEPVLGGEVPDLLTKVLQESERISDVSERAHHQAVLKMELRDQAILDKYQDEIFRLPLDSRLLILGPPGTGKTTTLIRRLGQKVGHLEGDEKDLANAIESQSGKPHRKNWLMFAPTELLRLYIKEAFARELVPASDEKIVTWDDYRRDLARNELGLLKSTNNSGFLICADDESLTTEAKRKSSLWYRRFQESQQSQYIELLTEAAGTLLESSDIECKVLGERLRNIIEKSSKDIVSTLLSLVRMSEEVSKKFTQLQPGADDVVKRKINTLLQADADFLDNLGRYVSGLDSNLSEESESEILIGGENENLPSNLAKIGLDAYRSAIRVAANTVVNGKGPKENTKRSMVLSRLESLNALPTDRELSEIYRISKDRSALNPFRTPVSDYLGGLSARYKKFREISITDNRWYDADKTRSTHVAPLELDLLVLANLWMIRELLLRNRNLISTAPESTKAILQAIVSRYSAQVLVDEVTDFSPVQIACMAQLAHPMGNSFFASGDFNQRLTSFGTATEKDLTWAVNGIDTRRIQKGYRQSERLGKLAEDIESLEQKIDLPAEREIELKQSDGVAPVLLENSSENDAVAT